MITPEQEKFDHVFRLFDKKLITREAYVEVINLYWDSLPAELKSGLSRRKDFRSLGKFALHVYDSSIREKFLVNEWMNTLGKDGVWLEDYGIANDGRLIVKTDNKAGKPDYRVIKDDHFWYLEVKFCPVQYKLTFKVCDLENYLNENSLVLLIMGNTKMIGPNGDPNSNKSLVVPSGLRWSLFGHKEIRKMLSDIPHKYHREVGGKLSVQLRDSQIGKYLKVREWKYDSPALADVPLVD